MTNFGGAAAAFSTSLICALLIVLTQRWHGSFSMDRVLVGAQKFHKIPVPRVGGAALLAGLFTAAAVMLSQAWSPEEFEHARATGMLALAALPVFIAGLAEDLTKRVSVTTRLLAAFASPLLASWTMGAVLVRVDLWGLDGLLQWTPLALCFTAFAVAGVSNAFNIIDGFNGLAGLVGALILAALAWVAHQADDAFLVQLSLAGIGAIAGFLVLNFPTGRLFLGDGGAYLLGFWIAEVAILLVARDAQVGSWQLLAICAYPVIEVVYSVYRKAIVRKRNPGMPDRLHFHMLVHRRFISRVIPAGLPAWVRNAATTAALLACAAPFIAIAALYGASAPAALAIIVLQGFAYLALYARLVRGHWCLNPAVGLGLRSEHKSRSNA